MKIGDLVKIIDKEQQKWLKYNPWMALKWGLHTVYIVTDIRQPLYKIVNTESGDCKWAKADEVEVFSEKV